MAYQPLLDAINNGKLGTQDSLEITYSISDFSSLLVQHPADKNKTVIKLFRSIWLGEIMKYFNLTIPDSVK